jgi:hypothetical protein
MDIFSILYINTASSAAPQVPLFHDAWVEPRSRIHEHTMSFGFLGIILRVVRVEISVWIFYTFGRRYGFLSGFPPSNELKNF